VKEEFFFKGKMNITINKSAPIFVNKRQLAHIFVLKKCTQRRPPN